MRAGFTLIETSVVLALFVALAGFAVPRFLGLRDRIAVQGAALTMTRALEDAREASVRLSRRYAVRVDTAAKSVTVWSATDTTFRFNFREVYDVKVSATRDSIAFSGTGLGYGASNARFVFTRGSAADTVTVSRIGRVRR